MYEPLRVSALVVLAHDYAKRKGFWPKGRNLGEHLCLIHSEVSEALEALREDKPMDEELADIMIRVADLAGYLHIDLELAIRRKMDFNETRPHKHGKAF